VTIPPPRGSKTYTHAVSLFTDLGAEVVPEEEVSEWASDATAAVYRDLVGVRR
jgi:hypothetical protein